jgi:hypothetical protein
MIISGIRKAEQAKRPNINAIFNFWKTFKKWRTSGKNIGKENRSNMRARRANPTENRPRIVEGSLATSIAKDWRAGITLVINPAILPGMKSESSSGKLLHVVLSPKPMQNCWVPTEQLIGINASMAFKAVVSTAPTALWTLLATAAGIEVAITLALCAALWAMLWIELNGSALNGKDCLVTRGVKLNFKY